MNLSTDEVMETIRYLDPKPEPLRVAVRPEGNLLKGVTVAFILQFIAGVIIVAILSIWAPEYLPDWMQ